MISIVCTKQARLSCNLSSNEANWSQGVSFINFFRNWVCFESNYQGGLFFQRFPSLLSETQCGRDNMAFRQWGWQNSHPSRRRTAGTTVVGFTGGISEIG